MTDKEILDRRVELFKSIINDFWKSIKIEIPLEIRLKMLKEALHKCKAVLASSYQLPYESPEALNALERIRCTTKKTIHKLEIAIEQLQRGNWEMEPLIEDRPLEKGLKTQ